ncbi:MAG: uroporphyrinogen decarboxylase family protein [Promethearchaeota archaeon]
MNKKIPDRVLWDYWAVPNINSRLLRHYKLETMDQLLDELDIDFRYVEGPTYTGPPLKTYPDGSSEDLWGVRRQIVHTGEGIHAGTYKSVVENPLKKMKTVSEIENYDKWPDPDDFDYSIVNEQCKKYTGRVIMFMGDRLNRFAQLKPAMYLRGVDRILIDMKRKADIFHAILEKLKEFYFEYMRKILHHAGAHIDVIFTGDDFGTQAGMFFRREDWIENFKEGFESFIKIAHDAGKPVAHHSCGSIHPIIPDMIDCGLDILNPVQPGVYDMDHEVLKEKFGKKLVFHGGVSLQGALRFGTPAEVKKEVKKRISELGRDGGYIICTAHNIQADTNTENAVALFDAYKEFSCYN